MDDLFGSEDMAGASPYGHPGTGFTPNSFEGGVEDDHDYGPSKDSEDELEEDELFELGGQQAPYGHKKRRTRPSRTDMGGVDEEEAMERIKRQEEFLLGTDQALDHVREPKKRKKKKWDRKKYELDDSKLDNVAEWLKENDFSTISEITPEERAAGLMIDDDIPLGPIFSQVVKNHQLVGIRFMWHHVSRDSGCILADYMGLGKTLQTISLIDVFLNNFERDAAIERDLQGPPRVLVISPATVILNWYAEIHKWLGKYPDELRLFSPKVLDAKNGGNLHKRLQILKEWHNEGGVLISGFEMFRLLVLESKTKGKDPAEKSDLLKQARELICTNPGPDLIVVDEGHRLKQHKSQLVKAFGQLRTARRVVLTGYPLQNHLEEYWCMVNFARPNYLGTKDQFKQRYKIPIENGQASDATERDAVIARQRTFCLGQLLKPIILRRDATYLARELPPKYEWVLKCRLTSRQAQLYRAFVRQKCRDEEAKENNMVSDRETKRDNGGIIAAHHHSMSIVNHPDIISKRLKGGALMFEEEDDFLFDDDTGNEDKKLLNHTADAEPGALSASGASANMVMEFQDGEIQMCEEPFTVKVDVFRLTSLPLNEVILHAGTPQQTKVYIVNSASPAVNFQRAGLQKVRPYDEVINITGWEKTVVQWMGGVVDPFDRYRRMMDCLRNCWKAQDDRPYFRNLVFHIRRWVPSSPLYQNVKQLLENFVISIPLTPEGHYETDLEFGEAKIQQSNVCFVEKVKCPSLNGQPWQYDQVLGIINLAEFQHFQQQFLTPSSLNATILKLQQVGKAMTLDGKHELLPKVLHLRMKRHDENSAIYKEIRNSVEDDLDVMVTATTAVKRNEDGKKIEQGALEWAEPLMMDYKANNLLSESGKMQVLFSLLRYCRKLNSKVIVFSQSVQTLDIIEAILKNHNAKVDRDFNENDDDDAGGNGTSFRPPEAHTEVNVDGIKEKRVLTGEGSDDIPYVEGVRCGYLRLDGQTPQHIRTDLVDQFNNSSLAQFSVFLASTRAAGEGLNLYTANRVIMYDVCWNPCLDHQSMCRAYRFGQKQPVFVYRLVAAGTMERTIFAQQTQKEGMVSRVVDARATKRRVAAKELRNFFDLKGFNRVQMQNLDREKILKIGDDGKAKEDDVDDDVEVVRQEMGEEQMRQEMKRNKALRDDSVLLRVLQEESCWINGFDLEDLLESVDDAERVQKTEQEKVWKEFAVLRKKEEELKKAGMDATRAAAIAAAQLNRINAAPLAPGSSSSSSSSSSSMSVNQPYHIQYNQHQQPQHFARHNPQQQMQYAGAPQQYHLQQHQPIQQGVFSGKRFFVLKRRMKNPASVLEKLRNNGGLITISLEDQFDFVITDWNAAQIESWRSSRPRKFPDSAIKSVQWIDECIMNNQVDLSSGYPSEAGSNGHEEPFESNDNNHNINMHQIIEL